MLNGVDVAYIDWKQILGDPGDSFPDSLWVLKHFYDEVEDWINDAYGEEGMPFDDFCDWVRFDSTNFIAEFPCAWKSLYEQGLLDAEDAINMDRFDGDEDQLIKLATEANPKLGEEVRQKLIEEGRLEESYRPRRRGQRRITESRKNRFARFGKRR